MVYVEEEAHIIWALVEPAIIEFTLEVLEECPWQLPESVQGTIQPEDFPCFLESMGHVHKYIISLIN
jgi:hypothetical protein